MSRYHSLPGVKPKHPPPPAPLSLEEATLIPEVNARWYDLAWFSWVEPMLSLGAARPLQPTDMWRLDPNRSSEIISRDIAKNYYARKKKCEAYNERLADPSTPLPRSRRVLFSVLPNREKREQEYRTKGGRKKPSLAMALSDTFGWFFWSAGLFKIIGDTASAVTPILLRHLITWVSQRDFASRNNLAGPSVGEGIGYAIGLFCLLVISSFFIHHFFVRSMGTGVYSRGGIITAVFDRALRFTQKSRGEIPNGKLVNHISTDTSRIDFCAGFFHMVSHT